MSKSGDEYNRGRSRRREARAKEVALFAPDGKMSRSSIMTIAAQMGVSMTTIYRAVKDVREAAVDESCPCCRRPYKSSGAPDPK